MLITSLPAAGKTSLRRALTAHIEKESRRQVSLLDGGEVRKLLSSELGFSSEHRRLDVLRRRYTSPPKCAGIAVCALIAPYAADRAEMRQLVTRHGSFIEIFLSAPFAVCDQRGPKRLCARASELKHVTRIDDPYEPPLEPDGSKFTVEQPVERIVGHLTKSGLLRDR